MATPPAVIRPDRLPVEAVDRYWATVEQELVDRGGLTRERARGGMTRYRNRVEHLGPILYHESPDRTAEAILEGGYADAALLAG